MLSPCHERKGTATVTIRYISVTNSIITAPCKTLSWRKAAASASAAPAARMRPWSRVRPTLGSRLAPTQRPIRNKSCRRKTSPPWPEASPQVTGRLSKRISVPRCRTIPTTPATPPHRSPACSTRRRALRNDGSSSCSDGWRRIVAARPKENCAFPRLSNMQGGVGACRVIGASVSCKKPSCTSCRKSSDRSSAN